MIETERLILRPFIMEDARDVFEYADWTCIYTILDQSTEWDWEE